MKRKQSCKGKREISTLSRVKSELISTDKKTIIDNYKKVVPHYIALRVRSATSPFWYFEFNMIFSRNDVKVQGLKYPLQAGGCINFRHKISLWCQLHGHHGRVAGYKLVRNFVSFCPFIFVLIFSLNLFKCVPAMISESTYKPWFGKMANGLWIGTFH